MRYRSTSLPLVQGLYKVQRHPPPFGIRALWGMKGPISLASQILTKHHWRTKVWWVKTVQLNRKWLKNKGKQNIPYINKTQDNTTSVVGRRTHRPRTGVRGPTYTCWPHDFLTWRGTPTPTQRPPKLLFAIRWVNKWCWEGIIPHFLREDCTPTEIVLTQGSLFWLKNEPPSNFLVQVQRVNKGGSVIMWRWLHNVGIW